MNVKSDGTTAKKQLIILSVFNGLLTCTLPHHTVYFRPQNIDVKTYCCLVFLRVKVYEP